MRAGFPYIFLLAEVLVFHGRVLLTSRWAIPWDLAGFHAPLASFAARSLGRGELPLWNPFIYCGFPFYANPQAQLFYPPAWPFFFLANVFSPARLLDLIEWQTGLHIWLAGAAAYALLRRLHTGRLSALFGATVFQLGGFFAAQTQHLGAICAAAWLPVAWTAIVLLAERFAWRALCLLAAALAMSFLAGFPAVTIAVWTAAGMFAAASILAGRARFRLALEFALAVLWACALSAIVLLPAAELSRLSIAPQRAQWGPSGGGIPLVALASLFYPGANNVLHFERYSLPWNATFLYLYSGMAGAVFALAAIFTVTLRRTAAVAAVTLACALWMLGEFTPAGRTIYPLLPATLRSALYAEFAMVPFLLGISVLAALGFERWLAPRRRLAVAVLLLTAADLTLAGSNRYFNTQPSADQSPVLPGSFEGSRDIVARLRSFLGTATPPWRIDVRRASANWLSGAPVIEAPTPNGNDPLAISRVLDVRHIYASGARWERNWDVTSFDSPILDLLNVRYILTRAPDLRHPKLRLAAEAPGHRVYENATALPRFFLAANLAQARSREEAMALLSAPGFDPRRIAVIEGAPPREPLARGEVRVLSYAPRAVLLETDAAGPSFLVTSETFYPGWRAAIDGRPAELVMTNGAFRGLAVPGGRHRVAMRFAPAILYYGAAISAAALIGLAWRWHRA
ncbi:MAG: hypothetical protein ACE15B_16630 [Bryobacteraceae bacterium]